MCFHMWLLLGKQQASIFKFWWFQWDCKLATHKVFHRARCIALAGGAWVSQRAMPLGWILAWICSFFFALSIENCGEVMCQIVYLLHLLPKWCILSTSAFWVMWWLPSWWIFCIQAIWHWFCMSNFTIPTMLDCTSNVLEDKQQVGLALNREVVSKPCHVKAISSDIMAWMQINRKMLSCSAFHFPLNDGQGSTSWIWASNHWP